MTALPKAAAWVAALLLIAAGVWVTEHTPGDYDERNAPLVTRGEPGRSIVAGTFALEARDVRTARSLRMIDTQDRPVVLRPDGVFVVLNARATSLRGPMTLATAFIRTADGREIYATDRITSPTLVTAELEPGFWKEGVVVVDVPLDALSGGALVLSPRFPEPVREPDREFPPWGFELTPEAEVRLGALPPPEDQLVLPEPVPDEQEQP
ncbi:MAG: hypothetical protein GEV11_13190 [Streptosporangiales bacterium]|nr:hypothetical protein [Streptosporangiales bacterium]